MRRCAKETALLRELQGVHPDVYAFGDLVAQHFCLLVEKGFLGARLQQLIPASPGDLRPVRARQQAQA
eukprot:3267911-Pyramimonas_sp.AAC.1